MVGKQLSALLQILRSAGVTRYQTNALTLEMGPAPAPKRAPTALNLSPEALAAERQEPDDDEDEPRDWRFALERMNRHFPRPRADPRKNKSGAIES